MSMRRQYDVIATEWIVCSEPTVCKFNLFPYFYSSNNIKVNNSVGVYTYSQYFISQDWFEK